MTDAPAPYPAPPAAGLDVAWTTAGGEHAVTAAIRWENEAWTITGHSAREQIEAVIRLSPMWHVRQFLLFRDLEEPDLWLGTDGHGRWGEVNGAHRTDLDGCTEVAMTSTPLTLSLPIRRLPIGVGDRAEVRVFDVDVETLGVVPAKVSYERLTDRRWRVVRDGSAVVFDVDEYGLPIDVDGAFRRTT